MYETVNTDSIKLHLSNIQKEIDKFLNTIDCTLLEQQLDVIIKLEKDTNLQYDEKCSKIKAELEQLKLNQIHFEEEKLNATQELKELKTKQQELEQMTKDFVEIFKTEEKNVQMEKEKGEEYKKLLIRQQPTNDKLVEFEKAVSYFKSRLGLRLKRNEENDLIFIFTHINVDDAEEEFIFGIRICDNIYELTACSPEISDSNILLEELNETNDLRHFVCMMRDKFKEYCNNRQ